MTQELTRYEALQRAVERIGTQQKFADLLGVSQPTVWRWLNQLRRLPAEYVLNVELYAGVSRHDLRPDIYPREFNVAPATSVVGEPYYECGPILSVRAQARHANRVVILAAGDAA